MTKKSVNRTLDAHAALLQSAVQRSAGEPVAMCTIAWTANGQYMTWTNVEKVQCARVLNNVAEKMMGEALEQATELRPLKEAV